MGHLSNGIISNKREQTTDTCNNLNKSQKHYTEKNKRFETLYTVWLHLCDFLERQNYLISGCQAKGHKGTFGGDGYVLYLECGSVIHCVYICHNCMLKRGFTVCELYLNKPNF